MRMLCYASGRKIALQERGRSARESSGWVGGGAGSPRAARATVITGRLQGANRIPSASCVHVDPRVVARTASVECVQRVVTVRMCVCVCVCGGGGVNAVSLMRYRWFVFETVRAKPWQKQVNVRGATDQWKLSLVSA
jgi:hypothetical protein